MEFTVAAHNGSVRLYTRCLRWMPYTLALGSWTCQSGPYTAVHCPHAPKQRIHRPRTYLLHYSSVGVLISPNCPFGEPGSGTEYQYVATTWI